MIDARGRIVDEPDDNYDEYGVWAGAQPAPLTPEQMLDRFGTLLEDMLATNRHLVSAMNTLAEMLAEQQPTRGEGVSSLAIEDMAKGPPKVTTKTYKGQPLEFDEIRQALDAHGLAHRRAEELQMQNWQQTVDGLRR